MVLTKLVKLEWDIDRTEPMALSSNAVHAKFVAEGKTDGEWEKNPDVEFGGQRKFVDQAAAEEYVAAITASDQAHGRTLVSSTIIDI
jgi:hypothetical protein